MHRRGFFRAAVAAGLALVVRSLAEESPVSGTMDLVRAALREQRRMEFRYQDLLRQVEPHTLGRMKDGTLVLLAWQVTGDSRRGPPPGWRNFFVAEIAQPAIRDERFTPRNDYRPGKIRLREIIAEVTP